MERAGRGRLEGVTDAIQRRAVRSLLGARNAHKVDVGIDDIRDAEALAKKGFLRTTGSICLIKISLIMIR